MKNRKYLGEYSHGGIVVENGIPALVSQEIFDRVASRMKLNKKAPARHKAKEELYLLTTKLFCGKCGAYMVGESGTSKNGIIHQYYKCAKVKKHQGCDKKTVRKKWIEDIVINKTLELLSDDDFIVKLTDTVFEFQKTANKNIPQLKKQIAEVNKSIDNILNAIENGLFTISMKERLEELEQTKSTLEINLANEEIHRPIIKKSQIMFYLKQFKKADKKDFTQMNFLIDNFVNSIYLYDDKLVLSFNYKYPCKTVTFDDVTCSDICEHAVPNKSTEHFSSVLFYFKDKTSKKPPPYSCLCHRRCVRSLSFIINKIIKTVVTFVATVFIL